MCDLIPTSVMLCDVRGGEGGREEGGRGREGDDCGGSETKL